MVMRYNDADKSWQVDRHIPIAVLVAILMQTIGIVVWATNFEATTTARLHTLEKQMDSMASANERLSRLESITATNSEILREIRGYIINGKRP